MKLRNGHILVNILVYFWILRLFLTLKKSIFNQAWFTFLKYAICNVYQKCVFFYQTIFFVQESWLLNKLFLPLDPKPLPLPLLEGPWRWGFLFGWKKCFVWYKLSYKVFHKITKFFLFFYKNYTKTNKIKTQILSKY